MSCQPIRSPLFKLDLKNRDINVSIRLSRVLARVSVMAGQTHVQAKVMRARVLSERECWSTKRKEQIDVHRETESKARAGPKRGGVAASVPDSNPESKFSLGPAYITLRSQSLYSNQLDWT